MMEIIIFLCFIALVVKQVYDYDSEEQEKEYQKWLNKRD